MRTVNPWFPMSFSIRSIVMECRYWKTLEDELCSYSFKLAQVEKINTQSEKKGGKTNCGKSGEASM